MERVVVGMSGGVDSAVAAYILKQQGYEVIGFTIRTWDESGVASSRCCEIDDARAVADRLGIEFHVKNCADDFRRHVTEPFVDDYINGITPNPCIVCNRAVKWARMIEMADLTGARYVATGHYASVVRLDNGRYTVRMASGVQKDQTYMLYTLTQEQLSRTLMPLGELSKEEVRDMARKAALTVADKPDSQEICFVPDDDHASYIEKVCEKPLPGEGNFVDDDGRILGRHAGIYRYTVGQRKGLGLSLGHPVYVRKIDRERNEVVISDNTELYDNIVRCRNAAFMSILPPQAGESFKCLARIRYRHMPQEAVCRITGSDTFELHFDEPVRAAAPGQSAVMYDCDRNVAGGGIIM